MVPGKQIRTTQNSPMVALLDEMKVAGYEGCEIGHGYMPNDDPRFSRTLWMRAA
ncbi:MAG: hypothetical protein ACLVB4_07820 [Butyricicoccus sp.]